MALSDYLTSDEWDACFYANIHGGTSNFGESMRNTIAKLLKTRYKFPGLNEDGSKKVQVENGVNAPKVCIWLGNPYNCDVLEILQNGRNFLKQHCPELIGETDEEWDEILKDLKESFS